MATRYIYPACSSRHLATIVGFPSRATIATEYYETACQEISNLAAAIFEFEPVRLYAQPDDAPRALATVKEAIGESSGTLKNIAVIPFPTNHLWVRDTGPVYVRGTGLNSRKSRFAINFGFAEWGGKLGGTDPLGREWPTLSTACLAQNADFAKNVIDSDADPSPVTRIDSKIHLEGGALVVDGEGTLLATESSILNDNRNPGMSKGEVEAELGRLLGVEKTIWMPGKKDLDPTDVHIDAEVNYVRPGVVALSRPHPSAPKAWWKVHDEIRDILEHSTDAKGRHFEIHILDEPDPTCLGSWACEDPATNYVNFYFVNSGLIVPQFGDAERDKEAVEVLQKLCPDRTVRPLRVRALPFLGGVIHCSTQQVLDIDSE